MTWCFITHFECRCRRWLMIDCNRGLGCQPWWPTLYYLVVLFWSPVLSGPWLVGWKEKKTEIKTNHSSDCPYTNLASPRLTPPQLPLISAPCEAAGSLTPWLPVSLAPWLPASWLPGSLSPWLPGSRSARERTCCSACWRKPKVKHFARIWRAKRSFGSQESAGWQEGAEPRIL